MDYDIIWNDSWIEDPSITNHDKVLENELKC